MRFCHHAQEKSSAILSATLEAPGKLALTVQGSTGLILSAYTIGILGIALLILAMQAGH